MNAIEKDGTKVKFDGNSYSVENEGIDVYVDGTPVADNVSLNKFDDAIGTKIVASLASDNCQSPNFIKFVDSDDNGKIDTALITTVTIAKVTYASSKEIIAGSVSYKYEDENIAKDIAKDDYVVITNNLFDECKDVVKAEKLSNVSLSGTKTAPSKYQLDGKWYVMGVGADMNSVAAGNKVDAWVYNGVVAYAKRTSGESGDVGDICVISAIGSNIEGKKVKIATFDGKETVVPYDEDDYSGEGSRYVNPDNLKTGVAYEYEVVKGEYRFMTLNTAKDWYGDYTALDVSSYSFVTDANGYQAGTAKYVAAKTNNAKGTEIADNAKVILVDATGSTNDIDTKVITGKQLKSLNISDSTSGAIKATAGTVAAFTSKVDGLTKATYVVALVNSINSSFTTNDNYAYITDSAYTSSAGYITYKVWTGAAEETVTEKASANMLANRTKGTVIGYSSIKDGEIEDVTTGIGATAGAIMGVNDNQSKVTFDGTEQFKITSDTVVLYVDTDAHEGKTSGSIIEADKFGNTYFNNVIYKTDGVDEVELLVVDVKNKLYGEITMAAPSAADLTSALLSDDVTVASLPTTGTVTVPAGKTLTVTGDNQTAAQLERVVGAAAGAKLVVENDTTDNATAGLFGSMNGTTFTAISGAAIDDGTYVWTNVAAAGATASYKWVK